MNKILITATLMAMFALTSCMKNEAVSDAGLAKGLSFGSYSDLPTKADSTFVGTGVTKIPVNGTFGVYSFLTGSRITSVDGLNPSFFSNLKVTFDGKKYTYSPTKYWPADTVRNKLSFFAYYPCDNLSILSKPTSEGNGGMGRYNYQVADKAQNQVDFMVSDLVPNLTYEHTNTGVTGLVNLKFHHLLSQVLVKAKVDAEDANTVVRISSIKFNNILSKGTMTPSYKDGKTSFEWSDLAEPKSYEVPLAKPFAALGTKAKRHHLR
ncbi:MAG: fimbrillin family protein [Bacteroidales bacterium]